jgi:hypothetical protein
MTSTEATSAESAPIDTTSSLFISSMQKMVGGGIRAAKLEYCPTRSKKDDAYELFQNLYFTHDTTEPISVEYKRYYPSEIEWANSGGLHLVHLDFVPWSIELLKFIADCYKKENIVINRREYIALSLTKLRNDKALFAMFKKFVDEQGICLKDPSLLEKIHLRIAEYAFRAYTKQRNNAEFNKIKAMASDKTNLSFRTIVQTTGKDGREESSAKQKASSAELAKAIGIKGTGTKRKRATKEEKREEYKEHYEIALDKLKKTDPYDPTKAKLTIIQCAAVISLGFGTYTTTGGKKSKAIREAVKAEIDKNESNKPFWKDIKEDSSKRQKITNPPASPMNVD